MEIYKDIKGYEGMYQVSNIGRVKSLRRWCVRNDRILKYGINQNGYRVVSLSKENKQKTIPIHRLVISAFKENVHNKPGINHRDCDKLNNHIDNLEWCTQKENMKHALDNGLLYGRRVERGETHCNAKLTEGEVLHIKYMLFASNIPMNRLAIEFNVNRSNIRAIRDGRSWAHVEI